MTTILLSPVLPPLQVSASQAKLILRARQDVRLEKAGATPQYRDWEKPEYTVSFFDTAEQWLNYCYKMVSALVCR